MVQLLKLAASVGKDTGGEVRLGAEQGDRRQDGAGDWRRLRKRRCRRGIIKTVTLDGRVLWQTQAIAVQGGTTVLGKVRSLNDVG
jgi:hypothetical protein